MGGAPTIVWLRPGVGYAPAAARSMMRLEAELGRPHDCNSSYRDYLLQESMWKAWEAWVAGRGPKPPHSRAIAPWLSKHCMGEADDSDDWTTPGYIALAARHGWIRTAASDPTERHHFEYQWQRDQHRNDPVPAGGANTTPPIPIGDDLMYIKARTAGAWARAGVIYTNDIGGHWRGMSNLEGNGYVMPLANEGRIRLVEFDGPDVDLLFALNGVWEQETIDSNTAPRWGAAPGKSLMGLGALTGKLLYPGQDEGWHYPITQTPPDVPVASVTEE